MLNISYLSNTLWYFFKYFDEPNLKPHCSRAFFKQWQYHCLKAKEHLGRRALLIKKPFKRVVGNHRIAINEYNNCRLNY